MFALTSAKNDTTAKEIIRKKRMKIRCDVCDMVEASVFCSADEAALCDACDGLVHHANKLASKHLRFSLLHPSSKHSPLCDICQERRALLFCQEDRAVLCRECDIPIHKANEHTKKHNRMLSLRLMNTSTLSADFVPANLMQTFDKFSPLVVDQDLESHMISFSPEDLAFWVPQVSRQQPPINHPQTEGGLLDGLKKSKDANNWKVNRKWEVKMLLQFLR
ncbi:hypothetical protein GH714_031190 [Hevea brasiliensis]|uniref:B box-type domain-containing protein n=1 Tax=Hevea brasiliensis TaxID=3981 RepID=A0A6A6NDP3_HEVBR|nr:hypothetical protein GH714_031190 [Hevea brasiliensis]